MKIDEVVQQIANLKTLSIPIIDNGIPHVRLNEVGDILKDCMNADVTPIYKKVKTELEKCKPQDDTH